jgi:hypothetical protein
MGHYLELNRIMALITGVQLHIAFLKIVRIDLKPTASLPIDNQ